MEMNYVPGRWDTGPGGIEKPGDFSYKHHLQTKYVDGVYVGDEIISTEFVQHCPKSKWGVCFIQIHRDPPVHPIWHWDGNVERPTIVPSIGCDRRCGKHVTIMNGQSIST